jgi:hypothetical protein
MRKLLVVGAVLVVVAAIFFILKDYNGVSSFQALQTSQVQKFDGHQQVMTDKPTGTVVVKGKLY